ncbi:hypothetical protein RC90_13565 [Pectobacterium brasiliense]|uniref:methyltransferase n=1 Tax=Pectobacterium brasiliense TaxID=180957 RepID=UPI00057E4CB3|nr:methyltransferase [Pectobacterium brasiliense]KHS97007.1 hypothetical protein RC90_13565 [Pectobacterium brasiliense]MDY4350094.1 methyltransferase [Pectobacterium brasiliense]
MISSGYDIYLFKNILHNWNDEFCLKILKSIAKLITNSMLLIIVGTKKITTGHTVVEIKLNAAPQR